MPWELGRRDADLLGVCWREGDLPTGTLDALATAAVSDHLPSGRPYAQINATALTGVIHQPREKSPFASTICASCAQVRLLPGNIQQHYIGALLRSFENDSATVRGNVEVANVEIGRKIRQLPLGTGRQVEEP